jgi:hypothetical protein
MARKRMVVGGSATNGGSKHDANQQPVHAAFYAGFPDFQVEVVPLKVRKDGEKFKLAHENAAAAHAKWNAGAPVQANKNWNNIRVLQKFGGLKVHSAGTNATGHSDDDSDSPDDHGSPRFGPGGNSDSTITHRANARVARRAIHQP